MRNLIHTLVGDLADRALIHAITVPRGMLGDVYVRFAVRPVLRALERVENATKRR